ncbi:hypothetical protein CBR_g52391 [Chara braunii]|uniref:Histidine kinase domain-containing protein n=1 Tax=Chara braunii TaxID=69332 RepID=A0A388MA46_CHABU|nr:hypothetical protein CBR_g52391 [Chara braunii]|eukprot:GBG91436.1 hypothetical protein CBR_g52391 [Chara braunii]
MKLHLCRSSDVSSILSEVVRASEEVARQKAVSVHYRHLPHDGINLMAAVEPSPLRQALCNLIDNGLQSAPSGGGWITVEARAAPAGGVLVVVTDNGPGLPLITQAYTVGRLSGHSKSMSTSGFAAASTDKLRTHLTTDEGTTRPLPAIGLAIAKDLVEGMGGVLRVDSPFLQGTAPAEMNGTKVELWLPAVLHNGPITLARTACVEVDATPDVGDSVEEM